MLNNKNLFLLSFLILSFSIKAQLEGVFGLYKINPQIINSAIVGNKDYHEISFQHRSQWVGLPLYPKTTVISLDLNIAPQTGLGFNFLNDEIGPVKTIITSTDFAYSIQMSKEIFVSAGVRYLLYNRNIDPTNLVLAQPNDIVFNDTFSSGLNSTVGIGMRIGKKDGWFIGFSVPSAINLGFSNFKDYLKKRYQYLIFGNKLNLGKVSIYPSFMYRYMSTIPYKVEMNFILNYNDQIDFGFSNRINNSLGFLVGFSVNKSLKFIYQYEIPVSDFNQYNLSTNEIGVKIKI